MERYGGAGSCALSIVKSHGIQALYRGSFATLSREIPGYIGYFGAYEALKAQLAGGS